jgi:hypothetical protein
VMGSVEWRISSPSSTPSMTLRLTRSDLMFWSFWKTSALSTWWRPSRLSRLRKLDRFRSLSGPADVLLLVQAIVLASCVPVLMRLPVTRVGRIVEPRRAPETSDVAAEQRVLRVVNLALGMTRSVLHPTCLTRGITRYYFLRRAGVDVDLAFGVGRASTGGFAGHCWLTRQGEPLGETQDPRPLFTEVYRIPRPPTLTNPATSTSRATC